ncbi:MAG: hypothetical protein ACRC7O_02240 [Fimbriiglobus sp.]
MLMLSLHSAFTRDVRQLELPAVAHRSLLPKWVLDGRRLYLQNDRVNSGTRYDEMVGDLYVVPTDSPQEMTTCPTSPSTPPPGGT